MSRKLVFLSLIVIFTTFSFISCGEGENSPEQGLNDADVDENYPETDDDQQDSPELAFTKGTPPNVQLWPMVSTGISKCYDAVGEIPCPKVGEPFYGQDGNDQYGFRSYIDNGSTVDDTATGVTWQKGYKESVTWYEAKSYCENLTLNSSDWRLPTTHELKSLIDYQEIDPALSRDTPGGPVTVFDNTPSDWFWASIHKGYNDASGANEASWIINFYDGFVDFTARTNVYNVRCVKVD